ncbi:hypothetical protein [Hydrogenophaga sp. T2]|uniref:hypothetical protein n=1 Tax=Hydrogenophaga sp. T2 TaxID=3132823 RepID=UPI003CF983B5
MHKDARLSASHRVAHATGDSHSPIVHKKVPIALHGSRARDPSGTSPEPSPKLTQSSPQPKPADHDAPWQGRHVAFDAASGSASVALGSSVQGLIECAALLQEALNERLARSATTAPRLCAAADALSGFLLAFRPSRDTLAALLAHDGLWWQLAEGSADSFALLARPEAPHDDAIGFAQQRRTGPVAALMGALIAVGDPAKALEVFKACTDPGFCQRVIDKLRLDPAKPLARLGDTGALAAAIAGAQQSHARLSPPRSGRHSRHSRNPGSRKASPSPHTMAPARRSSQNLRASFAPPWDTGAVLNGLSERLGPACGAHGWAFEAVDGGIRLVHPQASARFPSALFLGVAEQLQIQPDTEPLYLDLIDTLQQGLAQDPDFAAWRDAEPRVAQALQRLQACCAAAYGAALARGDTPGASRAFAVWRDVSGLTGEDPERLRTREAGLVGERLLDALRQRDTAAVDRLLGLLLQIEDPAAVFCGVLGTAAGACVTAADALALIAMVTRFLTSDTAAGLQHACGPLENLVLRYWPGEFARLLQPAGVAPAADATPEDSAAHDRLAHWIWLCRSLNPPFDWTQAPALAAHVGHRWSNGFELALPLKRLKALQGPTDAAADADAIERRLTEQVQSLPCEAQARLLLRLHGPDGARLCPPGPPDMLLEGLLHWGRESGGSAALLNRLQDERHQMPPLFRALLDTIAQAPRPEWPASIGALLAQVACHVVPAAVGKALLQFVTAHPAARQNKDINALLPVVVPLLPFVDRLSSVALTKRLSPQRLRKAELAHFSRHLTFHTQDDFLKWFQAFYSDPHREDQIQVLRAWLMEHQDTPQSPPRLWSTVEAAVVEMERVRAPN